MRSFAQSTRSSPRNSPHAAGRLVALALISNGEIKPVEWARLRDIDAPARLGLARLEWHDIMDALCHDLLATAPGAVSCVVDSETMGLWFDELDDRKMQSLVMFLSAELILADGRIDAGEAALLRVANERWGSARRTGQAPVDTGTSRC
ncbi:MAG TPA: hypothetical protein VGE20_07820 [Ramlibacter sp.]